MKTIASKRCFNHPTRMAAARCPECGRYFCRECITEHSGRVLCAGCLGGGGTQPADRKVRWRYLAHAAGWTAGVWISWVFFYCMAQVLLRIPVAFHEGSFWQQGWWKG